MTEAPEAFDVSAIVPWFGAKRRLAAEIAAEIGPHSAYFELLCGSLAVLLEKSPCPMETVNDLHGDVVNLARVIADETLGSLLYRRCRRTLMCEVLYREAAARWKLRGARTPAPNVPDMDRAFDFFFTSWVGRNGVVGTHSYNQGFAMRYTPNGGHGGTRWQSAVSSIPAWRRRLRNVIISNRDAFDLIEKIDDCDGIVIYCDPPYLEKGAKYVHDFSECDHERLATALRKFRRTRVLVSYYEHPRLSELYPGWTSREFNMTKSLNGVNRRGGENKTFAAPERLLINGPSLVEVDGLFMEARR